MDTKPTSPVLDPGHAQATGLVFAALFPTAGDYKDYINNITPTNSGVTSGTGANGNRAIFDNVNDYLDYGASNVFMPGTSLTCIIGWKKTDATDRDAQAICVDATGADRFWFTPNHWVNGFVYCDFGGSAAPPNRIVDVAPGAAGDDIWGCVMGNTVKQLWKNGTKTAEIALGTTYTPSTATLRINKAVNLQGGDLGECDFILIYSGEKSAGEMAAIMADPFAPFRAPPVPTVSTATINSAADRITVVWSAATDVVAISGSLSGARNSIALGNLISGDGTATHVYGLSPTGKVFKSDFEGAITLNLGAGMVESSSGAVANEAVTGQAVTNSSGVIYTPTGTHTYKIAADSVYSNEVDVTIGGAETVPARSRDRGRHRGRWW